MLSRMGLRLSPDKTLITHVDEGLDFLGCRIQRHRKRGTNRPYVYTYPTKKALRAAMATVQTLCRQVGTNNPLDALLLRLNPALRWLVRLLPAGCVGRNLRLPRPLRGVAGRTVAATQTRPDHLEGTAPPPLRQWMVASQPGTATVQPRDSAHHALPIPGSSHPVPLAGLGLRTSHPLGTCGEPGAQKRARRVREAVRENGPVERPAPRPGPTSQLTP